MEETVVVWTDYMKYRLRLRAFDIAMVERIVRYSSERYADTETGRTVAVGRDGERLVMVPYERNAEVLTPITVHVTNRQQVSFRVRSGRFRNE
jgi:hypothetical protein